MRNKTLRRIAAFAIATAMAVTMVPATNAQARTRKPKIASMDSTTIPIGKSGRHYAYRTDKGTWVTFDNNIYIKNKLSGAKYTYKSNHPDIVKVDKNGILTGLKKGSAKITAYQNYHGRTTTIGSKKISVKESSFYSNTDKDKTFELGNSIYENGASQEVPVLEKDQGGVHIGQGTYNGSVMGLLYRNPSAKYTFETNSEDLTISQTKNTSITEVNEKDFKFYTDYYSVTAKKAGKYTVTVKETYKKHTRNLGTHDVEVYNTEPAVTSVQKYVGQQILAEELFKHFGDGYDTIKVVDGKAIAEVKELTNFRKGNGKYNTDIIEWQESNLFDDGYIDNKTVILLTSEGKVTLQCVGKNNEDYGTVEINVISNHCAGVKSNEYHHDYDTDESIPGAEMYVGDKEELNRVDNSDGTNYDYGSYFINGQSDAAPVTDPVTITSSDDSIVSVTREKHDRKIGGFGFSYYLDYNIPDGINGYYGDDNYYAYYMTALKEGTATITISCGGYSDTFPVTVTNIDD